MITTALDRLAAKIGQQGHYQSRTSIHPLTSSIRNVLATARIWRARAHYRRELAARSERELRDMGTCWASIADEVSKPFWRG
jgi:uncharacterized protein YjiS (DUF1127 family)